MYFQNVASSCKLSYWLRHTSESHQQHRGQEQGLIVPDVFILLNFTQYFDDKNTIYFTVLAIDILHQDSDSFCSTLIIVMDISNLWCV